MRLWTPLTTSLAVLLLAAAVLVPTPAEAPAGDCVKLRTGSYDVTLTSAGERRTVHMHVPRVLSGAKAPLVVAFHGAGANGSFMESYSGLSAVADEAGFIVAYPSAWGAHPLWSLNDEGRNGLQDRAFVSDLLDRMEDAYCVDPHRIYATGVSNGGGFTARIGCELAERFTAIAPVAGGYKAIPDCDATRPVSVLEIHGTADHAVPYHGVPPDYRGSVRRYLNQWVRLNHCSPKSSVQHVAKNPPTILRVWSRCATGTLVAHIERYGRGHEWPGGFGQPGMSAARAVWAFFRGLRSG
jgi:polyhydroxybutyrate depolymerase